jgi:hypothetical protein
MRLRFWVGFGALALCGLAINAGSIQAGSSSLRWDDGVKPMDADMHDFMEGVFESSYRRLKPLVSKQPGNNSTWKSIRAESLVLGESCNLLLFRLPEKDVDIWKKLSIENREACSALLAAAKEKNYETTRKAYEGMLEKCNACHNQFAEGKHQMNP